MFMNNTQARSRNIENHYYTSGNLFENVNQAASIKVGIQKNTRPDEEPNLTCVAKAMWINRDSDHGFPIN